MKKKVMLFFIFGWMILKSQQDFFPVDFDESMQSSNYQALLQKPHNQLLMHFFHGLYKRVLNRPIYSEPRIPKIIHQIWLGSAFPEQYKAYQESWIKFHPDWEFKLWTEEDVENFVWANRDLFENALNYGEKSDIWRYEILEQFGGLYIDVDMECLKAIDDLHDSFDFYIGIQPLDTTCVQLGIGIFGSIPHHPLLKACIEELRNNTHETQIIIKTGPLFFTKIFLKHAGKFGLHDIALPASYFYPCGYAQKGTVNNLWVKPESFAVHHWAGSWLSKKAFVKV